MTPKLSDKWRKSKRAKALGHAIDAWWYGGQSGIDVVIQAPPGAAPLLSAHIPKATILKWADELRSKRKPPSP